MTMQLPILNNLCKRWILPPHFRNQCDLYFLRNYSQKELQNQLDYDEQVPFIRELGVNFEVLFMYESQEVFMQNLSDKEPSPIHYWLSFRSLSFQWNGETCTKSFVLVQVDKKPKSQEILIAEKIEKLMSSDGAEPLSDKAVKVSLPSTGKTKQDVAIDCAITAESLNLHSLGYPMTEAREIATKHFKTFAERSQPGEKDDE